MEIDEKEINTQIEAVTDILIQEFVAFSKDAQKKGMPIDHTTFQQWIIGKLATLMVVSRESCKLLERQIEENNRQNASNNPKEPQ